MYIFIYIYICMYKNIYMYIYTYIYKPGTLNPEIFRTLNIETFLNAEVSQNLER